jgi:chemotaxis signal transduction protein
VSPGRAHQMRGEFDASFTRMPAPRAADPDNVLVVRVDDEPCLLRLSDIGRLVSRPVLTAVPPAPGTAPSLLGLSWCQGELVAVHDLGRLLGRSPTPPRWLAVTAAAPTVGLAFAQFDGHRRIAPDEVPGAGYLDVDALVHAVTSPMTSPVTSPMTSPATSPVTSPATGASMSPTIRTASRQMETER